MTVLQCITLNAAWWVWVLLSCPVFPGLLRAQDGRRVGLRVGLVLKVSGVIIYDVQRRFLADSSMSLGLSSGF